MNKLYTLLIAAAMLLSIPAAAQESTSGVYGTATQTTGAVFQNTVSVGLPAYTWTGEDLLGVHSASFGVGGSETVSVGFSAQPSTNCWRGEDANGTGSVTGATTVQGGLISGPNTDGSWAKGTTSGAGNVSVDSNPCSNTPDYLNGSGNLTTGTSALIGNFTVTTGGLSPVNGAFASSATTGGFNFSASNGNWSGNGYTTQNSCSQVFNNLGNGFSATSSSSVTSVACPVVTK